MAYIFYVHFLDEKIEPKKNRKQHGLESKSSVYRSNDQVSPRSYSGQPRPKQSAVLRHLSTILTTLTTEMAQHVPSWPSHITLPVPIFLNLYSPAHARLTRDATKSLLNPVING